MSKLTQLLGKPIQINLDGVELDIHPLKMKDLPLMMKMSSKDPEAQGRAMEAVVTKTLKLADPTATAEEIDGLSMKYLEPLTNAIMDANGLSDDKLKNPSSKSE